MLIWSLVIVLAALLLGWWFAQRRYVRLLQSLRRLALDGKLEQGDAGKVWSGYLQDLYAQTKKAKRLALREKDDLKGVMQFLSSPVWIQNEQGIILRGNTAFCQLLHKKFEPDFYWNLIESAELFRFVDSFTADQQKAKKIKLNGNYFAAGGSILPSGGKLFVLQDISDLYELQLLKKEFLINISHELKTPLTTIIGFLELLPSPEDDQVLSILKRSAERLKRLVDDILQLATVESELPLELEQVDLVRVVQESKLLFPVGKIPIKLRFDRPVMRVSADFFRLQQVVVNLLSNAVKYTHSGEILVEVVKKGEYICLKVSDTGVGIAPQNLPKIFQRFFVGDSSRSKTVDNTGLGLAIVKNIVEKHGWQIAVESQLGVGTQFKVTIPAQGK